MSDSDFDIDLLFEDDTVNSFVENKSLLTYHTTVWCTHKLYNTPTEHPDKLKHIDMNIRFDESNPDMKNDYENDKITQIVLLPVKEHHYTKRLLDYSHDIFYMVNNKEPTSVIDEYIRTINSDTLYCINHPPFRFRYLNVVVVVINSSHTSQYLYC